MIFDVPYFFENKEWYEEDPEGGYVLTEKAPQKAIESFIEYYSKIEDPASARKRAMRATVYSSMMR